MSYHKNRKTSLGTSFRKIATIVLSSAAIAGCAEMGDIVSNATVNALGLNQASLEESPSCMTVGPDAAITVMRSKEFDIHYSYDSRVNLACCLAKTNRGSSSPILSGLCLKKGISEAQWRVTDDQFGSAPSYDKNLRFDTKRQAYDYAAKVLAR